MKFLANICCSRTYWLLVFIFALSLELIALYYQYQLGYGPCLLCVEVRAIVLAIMVIALVGIFTSRQRVMANLMNILLAISGVAFYIKSNLLVRIERNEIESTCGFKADFPNWLPLDVWLPAVFEPWEACGYTPMMKFGLTMGEVLVYCSYFIFALGAVALILNLIFGKKKTAQSLYTNSSL